MIAYAHTTEELFKRSCVLFTQEEQNKYRLKNNCHVRTPCSSDIGTVSVHFCGSSEHEWSVQMRFTECGMLENTKVFLVMSCAPPYMHFWKRQDCVLLHPSFPGISDERAAETSGRAGEQEGEGGRR